VGILRRSPWRRERHLQRFKRAVTFMTASSSSFSLRIVTVGDA
jgi:hypothetical protein